MKVLNTAGPNAGQVEDHSTDVARRLIQMGQARAVTPDDVDEIKKARPKKGAK